MIKTETIAKGKCFGSPARQRDSLVSNYYSQLVLAGFIQITLNPKLKVNIFKKDLLYAEFHEGKKRKTFMYNLPGIRRISLLIS